MMELTVPAALEELEHVQEFVEQALEEQGISMKIQMQISIAVEEIYVNIARYAYHPEIGQATVRCAVGGNPLQVTIQFLDSGKPFDPLPSRMQTPPFPLRNGTSEDWESSW